MFNYKSEMPYHMHPERLYKDEMEEVGFINRIYRKAMMMTTFRKLSQKGLDAVLEMFREKHLKNYHEDILQELPVYADLYIGGRLEKIALASILKHQNLKSKELPYKDEELMDIYFELTSKKAKKQKNENYTS